MAVKESLKFNWFEIKSNINPEETIDLRAGTARLEYRESVFSPYIEVTGYLADTGNTVPDKDEDGEAVGLLDGEFGTGTEEIVFEIEDAKGNKVSLANEDGLDLRVSSVTSIKQSFQNQSFTLTAVSKEAFDNAAAGIDAPLQDMLIRNSQMMGVGGSAEGVRLKRSKKFKAGETALGTKQLGRQLQLKSLNI